MVRMGVRLPAPCSFSPCLQCPKGWVHEWRAERIDDAVAGHDMMKARTGRLGVSFKGRLEPAKGGSRCGPSVPVCLLLRWKGRAVRAGAGASPAQAPVTAPLPERQRCSERFRPQHLHVGEKTHHAEVLVELFLQAFDDLQSDPLFAQDLDADVGAGRPGGVAGAVGAVLRPR